MLEGPIPGNGTLWSGVCFHGIFWILPSLWKSWWINTFVHLSLWSCPLNANSFSSERWHQSEGQNEVSYRTQFMSRARKAPGWFIFLPWPAKSPEKNSIENLCDHIDWLIPPWIIHCVSYWSLPQYCRRRSSLSPKSLSGAYLTLFVPVSKGSALRKFVILAFEKLSQ